LAAEIPITTDFCRYSLTKANAVLLRSTRAGERQAPSGGRRTAAAEYDLRMVDAIPPP
jgi:hypothetical protein